MSTGIDLDAAWTSLPSAHGPPVARGRIRRQPEDFQVFEDLGFAPDGEGEHWLVLVRKRQCNTPDAARWLAEALDLPAGAVTWAGLKDRHAVTEQWLGVHAPGIAPQWPVDTAGIQLLGAYRHRRKLRIGALRGNRFHLVLRQVEGDPGAIHRRLIAIARHGVPNYFGAQRFGVEGGNLAGALRLFAGRRERNRTRRGLYLSAARSFLFNRVLAARVVDDSWNRALPGDLMTFSGSRSLFLADGETAEDPRLHRLDLHPTGPLPGEGGKQPAGLPLEEESRVLGDYADLSRGLAAARMTADRRALRLPVEALHWRQLDGDVWEIGFTLPAGAYATSVLREIGLMGEGSTGESASAAP